MPKAMLRHAWELVIAPKTGDFSCNGKGGLALERICCKMEKLEYLLYRSPPRTSYSALQLMPYPACWPLALTLLMGKNMPKLCGFILAGDLVRIHSSDLELIGQQCAQLEVLYVAGMHSHPFRLPSLSHHPVGQEAPLDTTSLVRCLSCEYTC